MNTYFATLADREAVIAQRCIERESQDLRTGSKLLLVAQTRPTEVISRKPYQSRLAPARTGRDDAKKSARLTRSKKTHTIR